MGSTEKVAAGRSKNTAGEHARNIILDKAIELFAAHSYGGVSIRDLTSKAGVNQAAVYYHFGTKKEVYIAAVLRCFEKISSERTKRLAAVTSGPHSLEDILSAFVEPHIRFVTKPSGLHYLRVFLTFSSAPEDILKEIYRDHFGPIRTIFIEKIKIVEPTLDDDDLHRAFGMVSNIIVSTLFDHGYSATKGNKPHRVDIDHLIDIIVRFSAAGIKALRR